MKRWAWSLASVLGCASCASAPAATPASRGRDVHASPSGSATVAAPAPTFTESPSPPEFRPPTGPASAAVYVPPGQRQPVSLRGRVSSIHPAPGTSGLDGYMRIVVNAPAPREVRLLLAPTGVPLPFAEGDLVRVEIDCRKGGWERVCDGVIRDERQRLLLAIAGSGDTSLLHDWRIERGALALSETRPKGPKSVRHTFGLNVRHARHGADVAPHEWGLVHASDGSFLVEGHAVRWEGARPLGAPDYLHYAIVRAPGSARAALSR